jgi:hypothetical protein
MNIKLLTAAGLALTLSAPVTAALADQSTGWPIHTLQLRSMPEGSVTLARRHDHKLVATISERGLTPGSSHSVELRAPGTTAPVASFGTLTADATGRADATLKALYRSRRLPYGSRVVIDLGSAGDAQSQQAIAQTGPLPSADGWITRPLVAVGDAGPLWGIVQALYNADSQRLTVVVNAFGLKPGAHAAHIHIGSCESQGAVKYMLPDLIADANGEILGQVRTIDGVTSNPGQGLYLNIHEGDSNSILANGSPTPAFRPLRCANF